MPKFTSPLIAVKNIDKSRKFYEEVLGMKVTLDFGANITLDDAVSLQENFIDLLGVNHLDLNFKGHDHELYFEEQNFDEFMVHLEKFSDLQYVHTDKEYPWGQRVVRFYDPDMHIIEVGESMESVFYKLSKEGLTAEEIAERTMHPVEYIKKFLNRE